MRTLLRSLAALAIASGLSLCARSGLAAQTAPTTTVIVVRHAEKAAQPAGDPPLTAVGVARARALRDALRDAGVSVVITTQYARTKATAQPTVESLSPAPVTEIVRAGRGEAHAKAVAAAVMKHAGHTVLVVGHSNTVPSIIAALGAQRPPPICDAEYDNLYIVTIGPNGKAGMVHARYGAPTPVRATCGTMK